MDGKALIEVMNKAMEGRLPELLGVEVTHIEPGAVDGRMELGSQHWAPNDFLHAASVVALADTCCGMGCIATLPESASGFTTMELKTNFFRTAKTGTLICNARMRHGGGRTQVWDAEVLREDDGKTLALFRCTQMLLSKDDPRTRRQQEHSHAGPDPERPTSF